MRDEREANDANYRPTDRGAGLRDPVGCRAFFGRGTSLSPMALS
jgi:hypothetical protein